MSDFGLRSGVVCMTAWLLVACQTTDLKNPLTRETPPSTVGRIADHRPGGWLSDRMLASTPSTLRVQTSDVLAADADVAITEYETLIDIADDARLRAEALQRAADLRLQRVDAGEGEDGDLEQAIAHYQRLIAEHPAHPNNDRTLYQLARAQQLAGDESQTTALLRQLGDTYPDSVRSVEARFRAGELLYQSRQYAAAEAEYRAVLDNGADSKYVDPAEYKYAWSLYQQDRYAQALPVLLKILDRELPRGDMANPDAALDALPAMKAERVTETLRVTGASFAALGGGIAIGEQLALPDSPRRLDALLHTALAAQFIEKQRYTDAAETWEAFIARHPQHALAPTFQERIVAAYGDAGFFEQRIAAQEVYAEQYAADAAYWSGAAPGEAVTITVRSYLDDLARHHHAQAQRAEGSAAEADYLRAAHWYARTLALYPADPAGPRTRLLLAEALLDGGRILDAAREFEAVAYEEDSDRAPEAAHAAVLAYRQRVERADAPAVRAQAQQDYVVAALRMAEQFPAHPQRSAALATSAADLLELGERERAIGIAQQVLEAPVQPGPRRIALSVLADAHYAQAAFPEAEAAYGALLAMLPVDGDAPARTEVSERLAASIYRQGEAAMSQDDPAKAAQDFLRVGASVPGASIRATADYDAAAALVAAQDWRAAAVVLEGIRGRFPEHALMSEVERKLAVAYDAQNQFAAAASVYARIAVRGDMPDEDRRSAAWRVAERYDQARLWAQSEAAYERYVAAWPQPFDAALQARQRLADLAAGTGGDSARELRWLRELVAASPAAGAARTPSQRQMAADAQLRIGRIAAAEAARIVLELPIERSLPRRVSATESAIAALNAAAEYGFAETTTAATYELATLYRGLGRALIESARPRQLDELEREQYDLLLEEQAFPFEERAIDAHEINLGRLDQGVWNEWVQRSAGALTEMAPARYGKHERRDPRYDSPG